jgi:carboxylesterase type B
MISNAIPTQPKTVDECQAQFDELCEHLNIDGELSGPEKLDRLRRVSAKTLCDTLMGLKNHTFRPVTDDCFIQPGIFQYYRNGCFAKEFKRRDLRLYIGEVLNEDTLYAVTNGPEANSRSLEQSISNYYPISTTARLLRHYNQPSSSNRQEWQSLYGQIIADGQVRAPSRFLVNNLLEHGVENSKVWRYLIAYRLSFITAEQAPLSFGVSHAMDRPIWNYSITHGPTQLEQQLMKDWLQDLVAFVRGEENHQFGTSKANEYKVMTSEGRIEVQEDVRWSGLLSSMDTFALDWRYEGASL